MQSEKRTLYLAKRARQGRACGSHGDILSTIRFTSGPAVRHRRPTPPQKLTLVQQEPAEVSSPTPPPSRRIAPKLGRFSDRPQREGILSFCGRVFKGLILAVAGRRV